MILEETPLAEIDCDDETFRISEELDVIAVQDSLREIGQLNPVILRDRSPLKQIVCGFRRVRALRNLGRTRALTRILSVDRDPIQIFSLALWDNLSHRQLNPLEKARVIFKLQNVCGASAATLIEVYLPLLGLTPHESVLQAHLALNAAHPGLKRCLTEGQLTLSSVDALAQMLDSVQDKIASLMTRIRLSASMQRKFLALLEDLSAIESARFEAPLDRTEMLEILDDSKLSPFQKGETLCEVLYRLRNPMLSQALECFQSQKARLGLPGSIRVAPHPYFEEPDLHVEFNAANSQRFREMAAALHKAAQSPELDELFETPKSRAKEAKPE